MDVIEDGVEPPPRRGVLAVGLAVVIGLVVGAMLGRFLAQQEQDAAVTGTVRLAAVLEFARAQIDPVHSGEDVKLVGQLINTGPGTLDVAPGSSPDSLVLGATVLASGASTSFTAEEPLVCGGTAMRPAPVLRVRATPAEGPTNDVALPLAGQAWETLRLQCLQRSP